MAASTPPGQVTAAMAVNRHRRSVLPTRRPGQPRFRPRPRDWRIRTKLGIALTLPALGFLTLAAVQVGSSVATATTLDRFERELRLGYQVTDLVHAVQRERAHTAGVLALPPGSQQQIMVNGELIDDERTVNIAAGRLKQAAEPLADDRRLGPAYRAVTADLEGLQQVRNGARTGVLGERAAFGQHSETVTDLIALLPTGYDLSADPALARTVNALANVIAAKELTDQLRARLYASALSGRGSRDDYESLADLRARQSAAVDRFRAEAGPADLARFDEVLTGESVITATRLQSAALDRFRGVGEGVNADEWWQASTGQLELLHRIEHALLDEAIAGADDLRDATWTRTAWISALILAVLITALVLSWAVGRGIARSLRALRTQALDVANITLPAAIERIQTAKGRPAIDIPASPVRTLDEFGEVSDAFTAVHQRAVHLAVEQATMRHNVNAMFVNLARRSQALVERQLQLLDSLEAAETDPEQLDNLFRLDHLATRMRRNDDNLLVLAGSEASRRWAQPVAMPAVVLAAMAEIDQYARIRHDVADGVFVVGHAVSDLVHLLAELLENATMFSPPDSTVAVTGWLAQDGDGAVIGIQDHGLGMTEAGVREANEAVSNPVPIDVAASERMGLVVVGHLAARHRIRVELRGSPRGVLAYVMLPPHLLAEAPAAIDAATDSPVRRSIASLADGGLPRRPLPGSAPPRPVSDAMASPTVPMPTVTPVTAPTAAPIEPEPSAAAAPAASAVVPLPRRPARAEAVLDAATGSQANAPVDGTAARWWTRGGDPDTAPAPVRIPAQRRPVSAGTNAAGLPIRVPMAQLPTANPRPPATTTAVEPDPTAVGSLLSRFYSGVQRATVEENAAPSPVAD